MVRFEHVSKAYQLGHRHTTLRDAIPAAAKRLLGRQNPPAESLFWALRDVSFEVQQGEILGIIGHNGAGKSTILKLLSQVTFPTSGEIQIAGRVAALIELGAGFHQDLTGRENIFLNASILGLSRKEVDQKIDEIIQFAGLTKFIDTPVKRYSSGMYLRLAFGIAAHVQADVLLIDEVLAVGDISFQQKCLAKMRELHQSGATILFVSHDLWTVYSFCHRAILLRGGQIETVGKAEDVIDAYRRYERFDLFEQSQRSTESPVETNNKESVDKNSLSGTRTFITKIWLADQDGHSTGTFPYYSCIHVRAEFDTPEPILRPAFIVKIFRADGILCISVDSFQDKTLQDQPLIGRQQIALCLGPLNLIPDIYGCEIHVVDRQEPLIYASSQRKSFQIEGNIRDPENNGVVYVESQWKKLETIG